MRAAVVGGIERDAAGDVHAAIAARTADALRQHAVRTVGDGAAVVAVIVEAVAERTEAGGLHVAGDRGRDSLRIATATAESAQTQAGRHRGALAGDGERTRHIHAAIAAATADGLRDDAMSIRARGARDARAREPDDVGVAAGAAEAAHAHRHRAAGFLGQGERGRHIGAAVATATADALRQHADGARAQRGHIPVDRCIDIESIASHAATATDAHRQRCRAAIGEAERAGNIHRAVAAAAAHALQQHAKGIVTQGEHVGSRCRRSPWPRCRRRRPNRPHPRPPRRHSPRCPRWRRPHSCRRCRHRRRRFAPARHVNSHRPCAMLPSSTVAVTAPPSPAPPPPPPTPTATEPPEEPEAVNAAVAFSAPLPPPPPMDLRDEGRRIVAARARRAVESGIDHAGAAAAAARAADAHGHRAAVRSGRRDACR